MWNEVVIGKGDKGNTAVKVFKLKGEHNISHNEVSYWAHNVFGHLSMVIFKNTPEGLALTTAIDLGSTLEDVMFSLRSWLLRDADTQLILDAVNKLEMDAFERGAKEAAYAVRRSIREALGISGNHQW